jgi:hypothetical protein
VAAKYFTPAPGLDANEVALAAGSRPKEVADDGTPASAVAAAHGGAPASAQRGPEQVARGAPREPSYERGEGEGCRWASARDARPLSPPSLSLSYLGQRHRPRRPVGRDDGHPHVGAGLRPLDLALGGDAVRSVIHHRRVPPALQAQACASGHGKVGGGRGGAAKPGGADWGRGEAGGSGSAGVARARAARGVGGGSSARRPPARGLERPAPPAEGGRGHGRPRPAPQRARGTMRAPPTHTPCVSGGPTSGAAPATSSYADSVRHAM